MLEDFEGEGEECPHCEGTGWDEKTYRPCPECEATGNGCPCGCGGEVQPDGKIVGEWAHASCVPCLGSGTIADRCLHCNGTGEVPEKNMIRVRFETWVVEIAMDRDESVDTHFVSEEDAYFACEWALQVRLEELRSNPNVSSIEVRPGPKISWREDRRSRQQFFGVRHQVFEHAIRVVGGDKVRISIAGRTSALIEA